MSEDKDPLWNPDAAPDYELARIQRLLAPYGARARGLEMPQVMPARRRRARALPWAMAAALALAMLGAGYQYRLAWTPGESWVAVRHESSTGNEETQLSPGQSMETKVDESATISVARIGTIKLSPNSRLRLDETEAGNHRVALEQGHMRARIWAPPGYFGVRAASAEIVDLGCDFDLWKRPDGSGRVFVRSGWVSYRVGNDDILVPEHYGLNFSDTHAQTPTRADAPIVFTKAIIELEHVLATEGSSSAAAQVAAAAVAHAARDVDSFSLLSLLSRWPALANTALYPRLGAALGVDAVDPSHRLAWEAGDQAAIDAWWKKMPSQPKQWWGNWTDLFG